VKKRTKATLDRLLQSDWFSAVGEPAGKDVVVLSSWAEAVKSCLSPHWIDTITEAANLNREQIYAASPTRMETWDGLVRETYDTARPLVHRKTERIIKEQRLPDKFEWRVCWDVVGVSIEVEYSDLLKPGFDAMIGEWYLKGHFPCGWQGEYPKGKLIVY